MAEYRLPILPPHPHPFPEHSPMTMTTKEVTIFVSELGQLRQDLGKFIARLEALEPQLLQLERKADVRSDRITKLERSLEICQEACGHERKTRGKAIHYVLYLAAAAVPGLLTWYLQRGH